MNAVQIPLAFEAPRARRPSTTLSTGHPALDHQLGGGWPVGAITEIFWPDGAAEMALQLLLPALARLSRGDHWLAWVAPPKQPDAGELRRHGVDPGHVLHIRPHPTSDGLWTVERALRSGTCGAVVSWVAGADGEAIDRLQRAARAGRSCGFLLRPAWALTPSSPARLRLLLERGEGPGEVVAHPL